MFTKKHANKIYDNNSTCHIFTNVSLKKLNKKHLNDKLQNNLKG